MKILIDLLRHTSVTLSGFRRIFMIGKALEGKLLSTAELRQEGASGLMHVDLHVGFYSNAVCVIMQL